MGTALSTRKKTLFAVLAAVVGLMLIELVLALFGVDPVVVAEDPYVGFQSSIPLFTRARDDDGRDVYRTSPNKLGWFNEQSFLAVKPPNGYRIFCLGGSTTYGRPYDDRTSFVGWLRLFLNAAQPDRKWEVINCGGISYASYRVAALMEELTRYDPDLLIVYSGHNEFLERRTYGDIVEEHPAITRLNLILYRSRIASLMRSTVRRFRDDDRMAAKRRYRLTGEVSALLDTSAGPDLYHRDDALRSQVVAHYRFNLARIIALAGSAGAEVIFVSPAANIKDSSPFKSQHRDDISASELTAWQLAFDRGSQAGGEGDYQTAMTAFEEALRIDDRVAQLHYQLGRALLAMGKLDAARTAFERARIEDVCPLRILPEMSRALAEVVQEHEAGLVDFAKELELRCRNEHGHPILGAEYFLDHVHPTIATHRFLAGLIFDHLVGRKTVMPDNDWSAVKADAIAAELEATLDQRDHARARVALARVLRWAGKLEESDRLVVSAAEVIGDEAEYVVMLAAMLERQGKVDEAIEQYSRALQIKPGIIEAHLALGRLLVKQGRLDEGIAQYRQVLSISPDCARAYHHLGVALVKQGRLAEAVERFTQALRIQPDNLDTHVSLGETMIKSGQLENALSRLREALRIDPQSERAHTLMGIVLARLGRLDDAVGHYLAALQSEPENADIHYNLGSALVRQQKLTSAVEHFEQAVERRPDFGDARFNLALTLAQLKRFDEAARHLERVVEIAPEDLSAYYNLSMVYSSARMPAESIAVLRRGLRIAPDDVQLGERLAWTLATSSQSDLRNGPESVELAKHLCELTRNEDAACLSTLAAAYAEVGRFDDSKAAAHQAIELAISAGDTRLVNRIQQQLELCNSNLPYRSEGR